MVQSLTLMLLYNTSAGAYTVTALHALARLCSMIDFDCLVSTQTKAQCQLAHRVSNLTQQEERLMHCTQRLLFDSLIKLTCFSTFVWPV